VNVPLHVPHKEYEERERREPEGLRTSSQRVARVRECEREFVNVSPHVFYKEQEESASL
jgi:hypothetical protein